MTEPNFDKIAGDLADTFRRAAFDRMMHEDGCPEGEQIKAGIAAIAPAIWRQAQEFARDRIRALEAGTAIDEAVAKAVHDERERCARIADDHGWTYVIGYVDKYAEGGHDMADEIAAAIRKLKED